MIRRVQDNDWLLISQLEHARIAAELAEAWDTEELSEFPHRDELLSAIRHHDDGWAAWELAPTINQQGEPRDFTEMSMQIATSIWTLCIDACTSRFIDDTAQPTMLDEFDAYLRDRGLRMTKDRQVILSRILEMPREMSAEQLSEQLMSRHGKRVSRSTIYRTITQLEAAGIIERVDDKCSHELWRVCDRPPAPPDSGSRRRSRSAFGGLWVSRHFSYLAERASESRQSESDRAAINRFLSQQTLLQDQWREQLDSSLGDAPTVEEFGFRWLQTFDRVSLWLCCVDRDERWQLPLPSGSESTFLPTGDGTISLSPFPFSGPISLTVESARLPQQTFQNDGQLTVTELPRQSIAWKLIDTAI